MLPDANCISFFDEALKQPLEPAEMDMNQWALQSRLCRTKSCNLIQKHSIQTPCGPLTNLSASSMRDDTRQKYRVCIKYLRGFKKR